MSCLTERTGFRIVILPIWRPKATLKVGWSRYIRCMICEQIDGYTYQSNSIHRFRLPICWTIWLSKLIVLYNCKPFLCLHTHTPPKQINQFHIVSSFIFQKTCKKLWRPFCASSTYFAPLPPEGRDHNSSRSESRWFIIWGWVKTLVPLVNIKIAGRWMFIPLKMVLIGIDP